MQRFSAVPEGQVRHEVTHVSDALTSSGCARDHFDRSGASVDLTRREFELIQLLADAQGQVLQREEMYQRVWGYAMVHGDRSVDVFVRKLRQKLERASPGWRYIHTHFGIGYRFTAEPVVTGTATEPAIVPAASPAAPEAEADVVTAA